MGSIITTGNLAASLKFEIRAYPAANAWGTAGRFRSTFCCAKVPKSGIEKGHSHDEAKCEVRKRKELQFIGVYVD